VKPGRLRVIGGDLRGRRIILPADSHGVRPTPDAVRETLFNWLMPVIRGARCLDLYAGSGALGIEALSRGAADVTFVEADRAVARVLQCNLAELPGEHRLYIMDARRFVRQIGGKWDIIFLDPPYHLGMLREIAALLQQHDCIAPGGRLYLEAESEQAFPPLPDGWEILKTKRTGQVCYGLAGPAESD